MPALISNPIVQPIARNLRVNWQHPIARGMFDAVSFNQTAPRNLAAPQVGVTRTSSPTWSVTARGPAGYATAGSSFDVVDHATGVVNGGNFAFRVIFMPVTWPANFTAFVDKGTAARELSFFSDTSGNLDFYGIGATSGAISTPTGMTAGSVWDFIVSRTGSTVTFYVNGIAKGTVTNSAVTRTAAPTSLGRNTTTGGVNANAKYVMMQTWTRALSSAEIIQLFADPYCWATNVDDPIDMIGIQAAAPTFLPAWAVPSNWLGHGGMAT